MINELEKLKLVLEAYKQENAQLAKENSELRCDRFRIFNNEECWVYDKNYDNIENLISLVCPVVMSADDLVQLLSNQS